MSISHLFLEIKRYTKTMKKVTNVSIDSSQFSELYDSCVYILKCYNDKKALREGDDDFLYYTDVAKNPEQRLKEHSQEKDRFTKRFKGNVKVSYMELYNDLTQAQKRKEQLRKLRREDKAKLVSRKIAGVCNKCDGDMIRTVMIDKDGQRRQILQCSGCKFWKVLPLNIEQ